MQQKIFREFLEEKGQRLTKERSAILQAFSGKGHFDPESLYLEMRKKGLKASRASVYRTLTLVEKIGKTEHGSVYEHIFGSGHHDHMVCTRCGKVIEFFSEGLERIQEEMCRERDFRGESHTLEIRGCCRECGEKNKKG
jgi:Fur family transcriptional regulator, ferric uptake regulator